MTLRTRDRQYQLEVKAVCLAAVLAGQSLSEVARRHQVNKGTVSRWLAEVRPPRVQQPVIDADRLAERIFALIDKHIEAIQAQITAASAPQWVSRQTGAELAALLREEQNGLIRLLAGLRPMEPELPAAGELGSSGTDASQDEASD
jgi:transposase-like protein